MKLKISPVDQSGLFSVAYYSKNDSDDVKTEILDLAGNIVYTTQEGGILVYGKWII